MTLEEKIRALNELLQHCSSQKYVSHYPIECEYEKLIRDDEHIDSAKYQASKTLLVDRLQKLEAANRILIKKLDFEQTCITLIKANDVANFTGLVNIGKYFGTGPRGTDVCSGLSIVLKLFEKNPSWRKATNKRCLDRLCDILREPHLSIPQTNFQMLTKSRQKLEAIIKADAIDDLMIWILHAAQEDLDFGLRLAASDDTYSNFLVFFLYRTSPSSEHVRINLLAAGQPSGRIAMHRAIDSEKIFSVSILLNPATNRSNELLRQLLIRDNKNLRPIDLIRTIANDSIRANMVQKIRTTVELYQQTPRLALSAEEANPYMRPWMQYPYASCNLAKLGRKETQPNSDYRKHENASNGTGRACMDRLL